MSSVQERLKQAREEQANGPIHLPVPGFADGALVARYRPVRDWASVQPFIRTDDALEELQIAADTLLGACEGVEAHIDGEVTEIPHKLGRDLAGYLGFDIEPDEHGRQVTDREALYLMVPQVLLMKHYDDLISASGLAARKGAEAAAGESPAG